MKKSIVTLAACISFFPAVCTAATISNGVYEIHVNDSSSLWSYGSWNAITSAGHPTGTGNDILYSGDYASTNYSTLRIYDAHGNATDYSSIGVNVDGSANLDDYLTGEGYSTDYGATAGWATTWTLPQNLMVEQQVLLSGTTYSDSGIYHTVEITNGSDEAVSLAWRNLYDWCMGNSEDWWAYDWDDGPTNQVENIDGTVGIGTSANEFSYTPGDGDIVRVSPDDYTSTYEVLLALGYDPGYLEGLNVTTPDSYSYVGWWDAYDYAFDYAVDLQENVSADSAGLSYFGYDFSSAYILEAGASLQFTQVLFGVVPEQGVPTPTPEPASILLFGSGLVAFVRKRKLGKT